MAYIAIILPMRAAGFGAPSVGGDCSTLGLSWVDVIAGIKSNQIEMK
jgi:hypothetical protein